mmetsp:Transcript_54386/g.168865  ORF Transcript_54386/g.168865 Transcript_54386/m.168865 type:complete len:169 (-) Transcript_54386:584-1090(-)
MPAERHTPLSAPRRMGAVCPNYARALSLDLPPPRARRPERLDADSLRARNAAPGPLTLRREGEWLWADLRLPANRGRPLRPLPTSMASKTSWIFVRISIGYTICPSHESFHVNSLPAADFSVSLPWCFLSITPLWTVIRTSQTHSSHAAGGQRLPRDDDAGGEDIWWM